jgi:hypothetical protein
MGDRFVDVSYRGLGVGSRIKLRDVTTEGGYLESTAPMPVGTPLEVLLEDGTRLGAVVVHVHEQVAGGTETAGMRIRPVVSGAAARQWWQSQPEPPPRPVLAVPQAAAIVDVSPVVATEAPAEVVAPSNGAPVVAVPESPVAALVGEAIEVETSDASSSSAELPAIDDEDASDSSASRPIATGSNGHGDAGRTKRKTGKRRKRNTR